MANCSKLREGSQAHPEPTWCSVTGRLESCCEAWRGNTSHSLQLTRGGNMLVLGKDSWRTSWEWRQEKGGVGWAGKMAEKGTQGQTGSGHSRLVSCWEEPWVTGRISTSPSPAFWRGYISGSKLQQNFQELRVSHLVSLLSSYDSWPEVSAVPAEECKYLKNNSALLGTSVSFFIILADIWTAFFLLRASKENCDDVGMQQCF